MLILSEMQFPIYFSYFQKQKYELTWERCKLNLQICKILKPLFNYVFK